MAHAHVVGARERNVEALWQTSGPQLRAGQSRAAFERDVAARADATWNRETGVSVLEMDASSATVRVSLEGEPSGVLLRVLKGQASPWRVTAIAADRSSSPVQRGPNPCL